MVGSSVIGLGAGAVGTLATDLVVGAAPRERAGAASAISETGAELGGALGVAILGRSAPPSIAARWTVVLRRVRAPTGALAADQE